MIRSDPWSDLHYCPSMIFVPSGKFIMGHNRNLGHDAEPHLVRQDQYWISRYPVTTEEYSDFVKEDGYETPTYWLFESRGSREAQSRGSPLKWREQRSRRDYPVVGINWYEALAYCLWLGEKIGEKVLLPTEVQWEKAARTTDGRDYPWGFFSKHATNHPVPWEKCNCKQAGKGRKDPVGAYSPESDSLYGVSDMAGNIWEWTRTIKAPYPWSDKYQPDKLRQSNPWAEKERSSLPDILVETEAYTLDPDSWEVNRLLSPETSRIIRGGAWHDDSYRALCGYRSSWKPRNAADDTGFRFVIESYPTSSGESYCPHCGERIEGDDLFCEKCHREHSPEAPCGKLLVKATYYDGYPEWGAQRVKGQLMAGLEALHFRGFDGQSFSLPWKELKIDTPMDGRGFRSERRPRQGVIGMLTSVIGVAQNVPGIEVVWLSDAKIHRIFWACDSFTASSVVRQIEIFLEGKHDAY